MLQRIIDHWKAGDIHADLLAVEVCRLFLRQFNAVGSFLRLLMAFGSILLRSGSRHGFDDLGQGIQPFFLGLEPFQQARIRHRRRRLAVFLGLEAPVSIDLHEPAAEPVRHTQERFGPILRIQSAVDGVVASFTKSIQDIIDILREKAGALRDLDALGVRCLLGRGDLLIGQQLKNDPFSELAKLIDAGVGIGKEVCFRCLTQLRQVRPIGFQELKVRLHDRMPLYL